MPGRRIPSACFALIAWLGAWPAAGQVGGEAAGASTTTSGLSLTTSLEKLMEVPGGDGEAIAELIPVTVPLPGDEIVYTVTFTNLNTEAVENVRITSVIPTAMRYLAGTAFGPGCQILFSVDGGRTYGFPTELSVVAEDGSPRVADGADYTHIRWIMQAPLDAGARGFARFGAIVR
jgi:uncharacterized repeat protein (TIGR01451 family)